MIWRAMFLSFVMTGIRAHIMSPVHRKIQQDLLRVLIVLFAAATGTSMPENVVWPAAAALTLTSGPAT